MVTGRFEKSPRKPWLGRDGRDVVADADDADDR
jgi:hypothetical protein